MGRAVFFFKNAQTGNGIHSFAYSMRTRVSFPGVKGGYTVKLTTHLNTMANLGKRGATPPLI